MVRSKQLIYCNISLCNLRIPRFEAVDTLFGCDARCRHALTAEMSELFSSGGSMHASVKLEGIDGRAPQERVEHVA